MKKIFLILLIIDFILLLFILNNILYLLLFVLSNILIVITLLFYHYKINVINIKRIINYFKSNNIRKKISKEEKYLEKIDIKTFDGSNGTTHPYIINFNKPFNNYRYYMVHTPYDNCNTEFENPSLCVSNDGELFINYNKIINPLLPIIKRKNSKIGKYYNDNFILYDNDELQIWYRYTEEDKSTRETKLINKIYRIITKDGINFSEPELMIDNDGVWYLSPSIIKINDLYYMYYYDKDFKMYCKTSKNLKKWNKKTKIIINNYDGNMWHGEVKNINNKLYLLFLSKPNYNLYFCETDVNSPFLFTKCDKLKFNYYDNCYIYGNEHPYKSTFLIDNNYIKLYIPFVVNKINWFSGKGIKHSKWTMTYTKLKKKNYNKYVKVNKI